MFALRMKQVFVFILIVSVFSIGFIGNSGCASIIPPEGGPRDTLPPELVAASIKDSAVNFRGNRITLVFDEYIDIQDLSNNVLFTPLFENNPEIRVRLRTMTINFRDSLEPNTTYTLNFGNAIRDLNESNIARNFTFTFSTGPALDSLSFGGRVILAETGRVDTTLTVMLHRNLADSAVAKQRPRYITRVNADGSFRFNNLPAGTFKVYALSEPGYLKAYTRPDQLFAFYNDSIVVGRTDSVVLYAYRERQPGATLSNNTPQAGRSVFNNDRRLRFTPNITGNQLDLLKDFNLTFLTPLRNFDSTKISLSTDSAFKRTSFTASLDTTRKILTVRSPWKENTLYNLVLDKDFAEDTTGKKLLKTDTLSFTTRKLSEYGRINMRIRNLDASRNPVLLFVQNDQVVYSTPIRSGVFSSQLFAPGDYDLRILYDINSNGKWDPGQFFGTKRQPELVQPIRERITIKAAWDNEFERSL
jgi:hypothetical protein